ncbi:hypothetical protein [Mesorhizobium sp. BE184]|uniref:hypothetical protein n=1 Tax=Mesorhizobium sp. BE184 TaxID=2817714 RepID=UPI00285C81FC|nr:hypothetical protein [Mesorhizobium sp. BE184]MDR7032285.1 hypothetical protein [Mesorhizobium sp. BE184]
MKSMLSTAVMPLALTVSMLAGLTGQAVSADRDKQFFQSVEGNWVGPGEIVAGKYKGTKFNCTFVGSTPEGKIGMSLDGGCRVGVFTQKMSATVEHKGREGYKGSFMGGAAGSGLDIISGNVVDARKVIFAINRNQLRGVMQARIPNDDAMVVTVSVRVDKQLVPVIGMNLKRVDDVQVGAIAKN